MDDKHDTIQGASERSRWSEFVPPSNSLTRFVSRKLYELSRVDPDDGMEQHHKIGPFTLVFYTGAWVNVNKIDCYLAYHCQVMSPWGHRSFEVWRQRDDWY